MRNRKKLIKDALSLFVTLGITAISSSATDALPLKENIQKGANDASNCIRNTKQKPEIPKVIRTGANTITSNSGNKQYQPTSDVCYRCFFNGQGNCRLYRVSCSYAPDSECYCR
jgi:hypothetical protein